MTKIRTGQAPAPLTRAQFRERFNGRFYDPAFEAERDAITRLEAIAWDALQDGRKAPITRAAGRGFADPTYEVSVQWLDTRKRLKVAQKQWSDSTAPSRVLLICGSARNDGTCPGEVSKTWRMTEMAQRVVERAGMQADVLDLSLVTSEYGRNIHPCKGCVSSAMPLCHWPCSCYPNHALDQADDWMAEIYERWAAARAALATLPQKPAVRVLSLSGPTSANTAVRLLSSRRSGEELLLDVEVLRAADARGSATLPLTTHLNGTRTTENLTLPGQSLRFQKRVPLPAASLTGSGWLSIPADGNSRDNATFFAYGPARPIKSIIVAPAGETADYLMLAAAPPGFGNQTVQRVDPANVASLAIADIATILWAAPLPTGSAFDVVSRFLTSGGHVIFFPPGIASEASFVDLQWADPTEAPAGKFFILKDWNHSDGPLRDGIDGTPIPAERLKAIRRQIPLGDATALARWEDGEPLITRRIVDHGTAWFVGSLPDYTWSNLGDADVLLPAVQRILSAGAERFDASYLTTVGADAAQPLPGETRTRLDDHGDPDPANAAYEAGVFRLGERLIAVNRPVQEDNPEILNREQLDQALEGTGYTLLDQAGQSGDPSLSRDVWRGFLIAVLLFLIGEALLCLPKNSHPQVLPQKISA